MRIVMDHIVLNVQDVELVLAFYCGVVGLAPERVDEYRRGEVLFPSVRLNPDTLIDLMPPEMWDGDMLGTPNLNHFCLCVEKNDWGLIEERLDKADAECEAGPMTLWGAHGDATSYYYKDPEGNRVEFRYYGAR